MNARHPPNATDCVNLLFLTEVFFPKFYPHTVYDTSESFPLITGFSFRYFRFNITSYHDHWFIHEILLSNVQGTTMVHIYYGSVIHLEYKSAHMIGYLLP